MALSSTSKIGSLSAILLREGTEGEALIRELGCGAERGKCWDHGSSYPGSQDRCGQEDDRGQAQVTGEREGERTWSVYASGSHEDSKGFKELLRRMGKEPREGFLCNCLP